MSAARLVVLQVFCYGNIGKGRPHRLHLADVTQQRDGDRNLRVAVEMKVPGGRWEASDGDPPYAMITCPRHGPAKVELSTMPPKFGRDQRGKPNVMTIHG